MGFHIPFEHRKTGTPIYIGFDAPQEAVVVKRKRGWNWWAFFGFPLAVTALIAGPSPLLFLAPAALLINLIALRKRPRKLATLGTLTALGGTIFLASIGVSEMSDELRHQMERKRAATARTLKRQVDKTDKVLKAGALELEDYAMDHDGVLPNDIDACMLMLKHTDAWGEPVRFEEHDDHGLLRSAGPDGKFDSKDDVTRQVSGSIQEDYLLPVD